MKNTGLLALLLALCLTLAACGSAPASSGPAASAGGAADSASSAAESQPEPEEAPAPAEPSSSAPAEGAETAAFAPDSLPAYAGEAWVAVNGNQPYFTEEERQNTEAFENYSELDELGRCGVAWANVCPELMPTEDREDIGSVEPTGWHSVQYDGVDGGYLYNRCHLIGFQLSGENANERNLITGTRYLNIQGMLPFENMVADYVRETEHHVLYRVTPVFAGDNLVASRASASACTLTTSSPEWRSTTPPGRAGCPGMARQERKPGRRRNRGWRQLPPPSPPGRWSMC